MNFNKYVNRVKVPELDSTLTGEQRKEWDKKVRQWEEKQREIEKQFEEDAIRELELDKNAKATAIWDLAWKYGKPKGYREVYSILLQLAYIVKPKISEREFPIFVKLGDCALRYGRKAGMSAIYYHDAGHWEVSARWKKGKLVAVTRTGHLAHTYGEELAVCSQEEWAKSNAGYIPGDDFAIKRWDKLE